MKVLKHPGRPEGWSKDYICRECGAILTVEEGDLYARNTAVAYAGEIWDPRVFFNCAVCRTTNDVTTTAAHGIVRSLIDVLSEQFDEKRKNFRP